MAFPSTQTYAGAHTPHTHKDTRPHI